MSNNVYVFGLIIHDRLCNKCLLCNDNINNIVKYILTGFQRDSILRGDVERASEGLRHTPHEPS